VIRLPRNRATVSRSCAADGGCSRGSRGAWASSASPPSIIEPTTIASWTRVLITFIS
jgi:hypothetical protein